MLENKENKENINNDFITELKLEIIKAITNEKNKKRLKQRHLAKLFGVKQPRVSDLLHNQTERFSLDVLINYLNLMGYTLDMKFQVTERGMPIKTRIIKNIENINIVDAIHD